MEEEEDKFISKLGADLQSSSGYQLDLPAFSDSIYSGCQLNYQSWK